MYVFGYQKKGKELIVKACYYHLYTCIQQSQKIQGSVVKG